MELVAGDVIVLQGRVVMDLSRSVSNTTRAESCSNAKCTSWRGYRSQSHSVWIHSTPSIPNPLKSNRYEDARSSDRVKAAGVYWEPGGIRISCRRRRP